jgi:hypothetical protein
MLGADRYAGIEPGAAYGAGAGAAGSACVGGAIAVGLLLGSALSCEAWSAVLVWLASNVAIWICMREMTLVVWDMYCWN